MSCSSTWKTLWLPLDWCELGRDGCCSYIRMHLYVLIILWVCLYMRTLLGLISLIWSQVIIFPFMPKRDGRTDGWTDRPAVGCLFHLLTIRLLLDKLGMTMPCIQPRFLQIKVLFSETMKLDETSWLPCAGSHLMSSMWGDPQLGVVMLISFIFFYRGL